MKIIATKSWSGVVMPLFVAALVALALGFTLGCGQKKTKSETSPESLAITVPLAPSVSGVEKQHVPITAKGDRRVASTKKAEGRLRSSDKGNAFGIKTIHFAFDSSKLTKKARETLVRNAAILKGKKEMYLVIQGHCDERGTKAYNLALGRRRANAARVFLVKHGVSPERIRVVSYGKSHPLAKGHYEKAWAKNRRDNFVIGSPLPVPKRGLASVPKKAPLPERNTKQVKAVGK